MENKSEIILKTWKFAEDFLKEKLPAGYLYHNFNHTLDVYNNCIEISGSYDLSEEEKEILLVAALLHDTGFVFKNDGHEEESAIIAEDFLKKEKYPAEKISRIKKLILNTKKEVEPTNISEEILHDADIGHIGKKGFFKKGELLRLELEKVNGISFPDIDWEKQQLDFLSSNKFYTSYAKENFEKRLAKNISKQRENISKNEKENININTGKYMGRGIDTLYRTTFRNHINLSEIADGKANMMISINTIILSIIITLAASGLTLSSQSLIENLRFTFPVIILLIGSLTSVVFAILSAKPTVTKEKITIEDMEKSKKSILFFGNFVSLEMEKFIEGIKKLKHDQTMLYDNMSIDLFFLGKVLAKKYKLLSYSYLIFMIGLIISVLSFILIFFLTYA
ncbi:MAG TPA: Pycsar system effector family protein [Ignavibacteriaceae bacterium]|nr:Pycsar system effector family protein [Ignavibacteriaceae bacterium]